MKIVSKKILSSVIFLVFALVFCILVIYPLINNIIKKSEEFLVQKNRLSNLERKIESLRNFQILYEKEKSQFEKIDKLFFDPEVPIAFIEFLEREIENWQLSGKISGLPTQKVEGDFWPSTNFRLDLAGSFPNFLKFLERLETGPWLIEILNLSIRRLTESDIKSPEFEKFSIGDVTAIVNIKVFSQ